jgi:serine protease Do
VRSASLLLPFPLLAALATNALAVPPAHPPAPTKPAAAAPASALPAAPALTLDDRTALGSRLVVLERAGKPLALGVILNADGRILTALSSLGDTRHVDARYADGDVVPVRIGHADRGRDLALAVPQNAKHRLGLRASQAPASALQGALGSFVAAGAKAAPGPTLTPTGPSAVNGSDGKPFPEAIAFTAAVAPTSAGSALIDANGETVAVVTRACKKAPGPCAPVLVGTPVAVVRDFLRTAPKSAVVPVPSLGIEGVPDDTGTARGLRVARAHGPATTTLRPGANAQSADVVVALDGVPLSTQDALDRALEMRAVGDVVDLLVLGGGRYRHVTLVVAAAPR